LQADLSGKSLAREIRSLIERPENIIAMSAAARKMARPDAAAATVDLIEELKRNV
jgi:UDP-N-acetylglucosamine:LPS N-acetylglucosamine transferase